MDTTFFGCGFKCHLDIWSHPVQLHTLQAVGCINALQCIHIEHVRPILFSPKILVSQYCQEYNLGIFYFQGSKGKLNGILIIKEPDSEEVCPYPVLRKLSVRLTDCSSTLGARDSIYLRKKSAHSQ